MKVNKMVPLCGVLLCTAISLAGCGALTGLPGHGGGKRFAVEQELVAAATRGAIKQLDLSSLRGKKVNLFVNAIGDAGSGNLVGGRYSVISQLRGDYIQSPSTVETSKYPRYTSTTSSNSTATTSGGSSTGSESTTTTTATTSTEGSATNPSTTSTTSATSTNSDTTSDSTTVTRSESATDTLLPMPERKSTRQKGRGGVAQVGVEYKGLGAYQNSEEISSNDLQYLTALLQTYLFLRGIYVVPPSEAEIDVYVTVDVFGTVRSRIEWFLANNEILKAKTSLEILAVDHESGRLVLPPQSAGAESEYNEQYILWAGPVIIRETLHKSMPLLSDFTDFGDIEGEEGGALAEKNVAIPYPFQRQVERAVQNDKRRSQQTPEGAASPEVLATGHEDEANDRAARASIEAQGAGGTTQQPLRKPHGVDQGIMKFLQQWKNAWQKGDTGGYLAAYSTRFKPSGNIGLEVWREKRKKRLVNDDALTIELVDPVVEMIDEARAVVTFKQIYRSSRFRDHTQKRLTLERGDGEWKIVEEIVLHNLGT